MPGQQTASTAWYGRELEHWVRGARLAAFLLLPIIAMNSCQLLPGCYGILCAGVAPDSLHLPGINWIVLQHRCGDSTCWLRNAAPGLVPQICNPLLYCRLLLRRNSSNQHCSTRVLKKSPRQPSLCSGWHKSLLQPHPRHGLQEARMSVLEKLWASDL